MNDLLPENVYIDTGVVVAAIVPSSLYAQASQDFCDRLASQRCAVYFSQILWLELAEAARKLVTIPGRVSSETQLQHRLDNWGQDTSVRRDWMSYIVGEFESIKSRFSENYEIPFDRTIWLRGVEIMADQQVRSHDAVHLATAYEYNLTCVATTDAEFLNAPNLDIRLIRDLA